MCIRSLMEFLRNQVLISSELNDYSVEISEREFNNRAVIEIKYEGVEVEKKFHVELKEVSFEPKALFSLG